MTAGSDPAPIGGSDWLRFVMLLGVLTQLEEQFHADSLPLAPRSANEPHGRREYRPELSQPRMALHAL